MNEKIIMNNFSISSSEEDASLFGSKEDLVILDLGPAFLTGPTRQSFIMAKKYREVTLYLIEPHPNFARFCKEQAEGYENIIVIQKAISDYNGTAKLKECNNSECSSILDVDIDKIKKSGWPQPQWLELSEKTFDVEVCRLDKIIEEYEIKQIDHIKIDIQGEDLKALQSAGRHLDIIKKGVLESSIGEEQSLYKGQHTQKECVNFLESKGFKITDIEPNDPIGVEVNIHFEKL